jgi:uncharacterized protein (TIGR02391 family)
MPISKVTRTAIADALQRAGLQWWGRVDEIEFLSRLYQLDWTFIKVGGKPEPLDDEIRRHRMTFNDWPDDWVFSCAELGFQEDGAFLKFLCESLHPEVRDPKEVTALLSLYNHHLGYDGYALVSAGKISNRPLFEAKDVEETTGDWPKWEDSVVRAVANVLGATDTGLTGPEIGAHLAESSIIDVHPGDTKRFRLRDALLAQQELDGDSHRLVEFVSRALAPVGYRKNPNLLTRFRDELNEILIHSGLHIDEASRFVDIPAAATLSEAAARAGSLQSELIRRGTHADILAACTQEVLERNWFHATFEASKTVQVRLRLMINSTKDGAALLDEALAFGISGCPRVQITPLADQSDIDEQKGFHETCKGALWMFRNPLAHTQRTARHVTDARMLEALGVLSMIHYRLDDAKVVP